MTQLTITPKISDKTARFKGTIAAGEHVAVAIKGGAEWIGADSGANLTLRVLDLVTGRTLAVFPYWTEDNSEDWPDDVTSADAWETSGDDNADLSCELNLNTLRMVAAARHMLRVPVMFVLGDTDDPRTLYFRDRYEVEYWPERIGDTVPYDLDKWPKKIDEWTELVAGWTVRLNGLKLEAERTEAVGTTPGKTKLTLNDGTAEEDTVVEILDGQVSADQLASAVSELEDKIDDKQDALTFDDAPTENSANPVKSGGVKTAIDTVATNLSTHTGNSGIHVTADQKSAWTAKYAKPSGGIPASDLAGEIGKAKLTSSVQGSLDKADTAVQPDALSAYVNDASYDSTENKILFKHGSTTIAYIDATAFIKDGMVSSVAISNGYLVITFNTDAGTSPVSIALTDIFNPANYYDKTAADGRFVQKEAGKGLVAVDATLTQSGEAADAKAVGDALRSGFTEWVCDPSDITMVFEDNHWVPYFDGMPQGSSKGDADSLSLSWTSGVDASEDISATRHLITPTKTSQLTNDGDGTNAFVKTNDSRLSDARTPTAHHATHAANGSDPLAPADIGAAAASDLPYRMVEPGKWEFSGLPQSAIYSSGPTYSNGVWTIFLDFDVAGNTYSMSCVASEDALSLSWSYTDWGGIEGNTGILVATRASLPGHLCYRANNLIDATSGNVTLTLPEYQAGKLRDLLVYVDLGDDGTDPYSITFNFPSGESNTGFKAEGDDPTSATFPAPTAAGEWWYSFTECKPHKFSVSLKQLQDAPQAQGAYNAPPQGAPQYGAPNRNPYSYRAEDHGGVGAGNAYQYRAVEVSITVGNKTHKVSYGEDETSGTVTAYEYSSSTEVSEEDGFTTLIVNKLRTGSLEVSKIWKDANDRSRPGSVKVSLVSNAAGKKISLKGVKSAATLNKDNKWTDQKTWAELPVYDAAGNKIVYSLEEPEIKKYTAAYKIAVKGSKDKEGKGTKLSTEISAGQTVKASFTNTLNTSSSSSSVRTGDDTPLTVLIVMFALSMAGLAIVIWRRKHC